MTPRLLLATWGTLWRGAVWKILDLLQGEER